MPQFTSDFDKYTIWKKFTRNITKIEDANTERMEYEGVDRGQYERLTIAIGIVLRELMDEREALTDILHADTMREEDFSWVLKGYSFPHEIRGGEERGREFIRRLPFFRKTIGTLGNIRWIVNNLYGWYVSGYKTTVDKILRLGIKTSTLYDGTGALEDFDVLYDPDLHGSISTIELTIDVKGESGWDSDEENWTDPFLSSKTYLESMLAEWLPAVTDMQYIYIST